MSTLFVRRGAWLIAGLLSLSSTMSFCRAQESLGYSLPDVVISQPTCSTRTYQVADLVTELNQGKQPAKTCEDRLIKLLTGTIAPESWAVKGGKGTIDYFPLGMTLVVNQTPDVQERIAGVLENLRKAQDVEVAVEVQLVRVPAGFRETVGSDGDLLESLPEADNVTFQDERQVKQLLTSVQRNQRANIMQSPKVTLFNGQDSVVEAVEKQEFVTGVDLRWNGEQMAAIPHKEQIETGLRLNLQPVVAPDRKNVQMHFQVKITSLDGEKVPTSPVVTSFSSDAKKWTTLTQYIQTPKFTKVELDKVLSIPQGKTALMWGGRREVEVEVRNVSGAAILHEIPILSGLVERVDHRHESEDLLILVTPRVLVNEEQEEKVSKKPIMPRADEDSIDQPKHLTFDRIRGGIE
jgi:general secretion pathway protein D